MLLSTLETTIVSTSLVSMVNELQGFSQAGWVITAYFLTYTGLKPIPRSLEGSTADVHARIQDSSSFTPSLATSSAPSS